MLGILYRKQNSSILIIGISYLFILLFIYAAVSKILDFETFRLQLAQSPLLSAYAGTIALLIPSLEILISIFLIFPRYRSVALYACFLLMVMFSAYIVIILNFSDFVPCSCGGVLEKMSWGAHLVFNLVFIILSVVAIILYKKENYTRTLVIKLRNLFFGASFSIGLIIILFLASEKTSHRNNAFIRRYPHNAIQHKNTYDLVQDSWYIAGIDNKKIYLGNSTAPLSVKTIDNMLQTVADYRIKLNATDLKYRSVKIVVKQSIFYLTDGTVPRIFSGSTSSWYASEVLNDSIYFNEAVPGGKEKMAISAIRGTNPQNLLGIMDTKKGMIEFSNSLLENQLNGLFDTDGILLYNNELERYVYTYYYRNEFFVFDSHLRLEHRAKTIDTVSIAQLKMERLMKGNQIKMAAPPLIINRSATTYGNYLFIQSDRLGKMEPEEMIKEAAIIDVYNIPKKTYEFSFYIHFEEGNRLKTFQVKDNILVAIMDHIMVTYTLNPDLFSLKKEFVN